jgi:hypothetical protein
MRHYDARKAIHDPSPEPPPARIYPPLILDVEKIAKRVAARIARLPSDQWAIWEGIYIDRLVDRFDERHDPGEVDAIGVRFLEAFRAALGAPHWTG